jgi:L-fuconolactonase
MILDTHQHFWHYNPERDTWIDESMGPLKRDFFPVDLEPILKKNTVSGCIAVQADTSEEETQFLLDLAQNYSFIKGVVGWVDLTHENVEERLTFFAKNTLFKGVRHILQAEKDDFVLQKDFQNGVGHLAPLGLTYDLLIYPRQIESAIQLIETFPNQQFILDHLAKPNIQNKKWEHWCALIKELAQLPNVACKLSGMVTEADWNLWKPSDFKPYIETILDTFGENRILFGSDWPVCLLAAEYTEVLNIVKEFTASLSPQAQSKLWAQNAIQIYNLEL